MRGQGQKLKLDVSVPSQCHKCLNVFAIVAAHVQIRKAHVWHCPFCGVDIPRPEFREVPKPWTLTKTIQDVQRRETEEKRAAEAASYRVADDLADDLGDLGVDLGGMGFEQTDVGRRADGSRRAAPTHVPGSRRRR